MYTDSSLGDMQNFSFWQKLTTLLSKQYADNWKAGTNFHMAMEALTIERMERHAKGEVLNDLFQPMLEDRKGSKPDITTKDRIAEVEQAGKSKNLAVVFSLRGKKDYVRRFNTD